MSGTLSIVRHILPRAPLVPALSHADSKKRVRKRLPYRPLALIFRKMRQDRANAETQPAKEKTVSRSFIFAPNLHLNFASVIADRQIQGKRVRQVSHTLLRNVLIGGKRQSMRFPIKPTVYPLTRTDTVLEAHQPLSQPPVPHWRSSVAQVLHTATDTVVISVVREVLSKLQQYLWRSPVLGYASTTTRFTTTSRNEHTEAVREQKNTLNTSEFPLHKASSYRLQWLNTLANITKTRTGKFSLPKAVNEQSPIDARAKQEFVIKSRLLQWAIASLAPPMHGARASGHLHKILAQVDSVAMAHAVDRNRSSYFSRHRKYRRHRLLSVPHRPMTLRNRPVYRRMDLSVIALRANQESIMAPRLRSATINPLRSLSGPQARRHRNNASGSVQLDFIAAKPAQHRREALLPMRNVKRPANSILPTEIVYRMRPESVSTPNQVPEVPPPLLPTASKVDVERLSQDVMRQIHKRLRIERERRGLL